MRGLGANAGFNFMLKDINGIGHDALLAASKQVEDAARKMGVKPSRSRGTRYVSMDAYQAGFAAGQSVSLPAGRAELAENP